MSITLAWIRREMRLNDNAVLHEALLADHPVQPVFVFDSEILSRFDNKRDRRLTFIAETLLQMHEGLKKHGGGMLVLYGKASEMIPKCAEALKAAQVVCAEDFEPDTRKRDEAVKKALGSKCRFVQVLDHIIFGPKSVLKDDGDPYRVFTPFSKRWRSHLNQYSYAEKTAKLKDRLAPYPAICKQIDEAGLKRVPMQSVTAMLEAVGYEKADLGEWRVDDVQKRLHRFIENSLSGYKESRNMLADEDGTSRLSPYLRFGLVSVRECCRLASERPGNGSDTWINELIWREFYHHILFHFPESQTLEFQEQYRDLSWKNAPEWLVKWKEGKTGFPVVDAAMRQLLDIGWMHNRARMIVASFLTKDLHLDWRLGEEHFAQHLMDYELSSNVGGWQWAASTGTDAQPYFRVFNPKLQSERFDPNGDYIRRYVPELRGITDKTIHEPHSGKDLFSSIDYPEPMVDHRTEKDKAIAMFKQAGS